jgi:hypothetical protein
MLHKITIIENSPSLFAVTLFETKFIRNFGAAVLVISVVLGRSSVEFDSFGNVISWSLGVVGWGSIRGCVVSVGASVSYSSALVV